MTTLLFSVMKSYHLLRSTLKTLDVCIINVQSLYLSSSDKKDNAGFKIIKHKRIQIHNNTPDESLVNAAKQNVILKLNFECNDDAIPFYALSPRTLSHIYNCTRKDEEMGFCKNRLYYISSRLKCPSKVVANYLAKRVFVYNLSFDWLESSLNVLLDMGVDSERILRDLWVLKYHQRTIYDRLTRVKNLGNQNLYPWMVRCTEQILERYIEISQETKNILGENESKHTYLAKRLNISQKDVEDICERTPALKSTRVTKLKSFIDFLISEGFSIEDISKKPRVLNSSQNTIKQRIDKLKNLGRNEINLNILCRSKKDFLKYCKALETINKV